MCTSSQNSRAQEIEVIQHCDWYGGPVKSYVTQSAQNIWLYITHIVYDNN